MKYTVEQTQYKNIGIWGACGSNYGILYAGISKSTDTNLYMMYADAETVEEALKEPEKYGVSVRSILSSFSIRWGNFWRCSPTLDMFTLTSSGGTYAVYCLRTPNGYSECGKYRLNEWNTPNNYLILDMGGKDGYLVWYENMNKIPNERVQVQLKLYKLFESNSSTAITTTAFAERLNVHNGYPYVFLPDIDGYIRVYDIENSKIISKQYRGIDTIGVATFLIEKQNELYYIATLFQDTVKFVKIRVGRNGVLDMDGTAEIIDTGIPISGVLEGGIGIFGRSGIGIVGLQRNNGSNELYIVDIENGSVLYKNTELSLVPTTFKWSGGDKVLYNGNIAIPRRGNTVHYLIIKNSQSLYSYGVYGNTVYLTHIKIEEVPAFSPVKYTISAECIQ